MTCAPKTLARSAKAKFLVQLAFYSALLARAQGAEPKLMHVVLGDQTERAFRCADYMHYYRSLLARFMTRIQALADGVTPGTYPLPTSHCDLCHWQDRCAAQRIADDHLCQVANISRIQWAKLQVAGVDTMARLAALPAGTPIPRLRPDTLERLRSQAELQDRARRTGKREVLLLRYYGDLSEAAIAAALGISTGAVKTHASRGMAALRPTLEQVR